MDDSKHEISWSWSSWLIAVFVILPLWLMASYLVIWVSYVASLCLSFLALLLSKHFWGYP